MTPLYLLILGRQGAGKGTQAERIAAHLGIPWISTGEMLRAAVRAETPLGRKAKEIMDAGDLVPDDVILGMVEERLAEPDATDGAIFDGFPRTHVQAHALDELLGTTQIRLVLNIEVEERVARGRMLARARPDDTEEAIDARLALYEELTRPLIAYYGARVVEIDGLGTMDEVFERCAKAVGKVSS